MELGTYLITYVPYSNTKGIKTDTVEVREDGHYVLSEITGRFNKTMPYSETPGFTWEKIK